jgi:hypothetical protein
MKNWKFAAIGLLLVTIGGVVDAASAAPETRAPAAQPRFAFGGKLTQIFGRTPEGPIVGIVRDIVVPTSGEREPINAANEPSRLHPALRGQMLRIGEGPETGEVDREVFPSSWWPQVDNGIAARWNSTNNDYQDWRGDPDNLAPTEKYDLLFYPGQPQKVAEVRNRTIAESNRPVRERDAPRVQPALTVVGPTTAWELMNHGVYQSVYPEAWYGHCNGWSSYITAESQGAPLHDVRVRRQGGQLVECREGENGCILFRMADIEALLFEVYFHDSSTAVGARCDKKSDEIERDEYGRPTDPDCRDVNPGTLHVALTGLIGKGAAPLTNLNGSSERLPFIIDYAWDYEVWTFPVVKYQIDQLEYVNESRAASLVCKGDRLRRGCNNIFNQNAVRFARVKTRFWVMTYAASAQELLTPPLRRERPLRETTIHYILELDGRGTIVGGEWIASPTMSGNDSRQLHPDFLFMSVSPNASDEDADDRGGTQDNPYVSYSNVKALLQLAHMP